MTDIPLPDSVLHETVNEILLVANRAGELVDLQTKTMADTAGKIASAAAALADAATQIAAPREIVHDRQGRPVGIRPAQ